MVLHYLTERLDIDASIEDIEEGARLVLEYGRDFYEMFESRMTFACLRDEPEVVDVILGHGYDINHCSEYGNYPLGSACSKDSVNVVRLLIKKGADIHLKKSETRSPIHICAVNNSAKSARLLMEAGLDYENMFSYGEFNPMGVAILHGSVDILEAMCEFDSRYKVLLMTKGSPLHLAIYGEDIDMVKWMLKNFPSLVRDVDIDGVTPLEFARKDGHAAIIELLEEWQTRCPTGRSIKAARG